MTNKRILITGGAGFLGRALIQKLIADNEITVFSRDEAKHVQLKADFPKVRCVLGDIRNSELLNAAAAGHDVGLFAASMKHVGEVNLNPREATEIIVHGALNSRRAAIVNGFESAVFVSSDKSRHPITAYGALKFVAGDMFIWGSEAQGVRLSATVCGNIINSTGSVIPMMWSAIRAKRKMQLYSDKMSRFTISGDDAADLIIDAAAFTGVSVVPKLMAFSVKDLFDIFADKFGLKYEVCPPVYSMERDVELMISREDAARTVDTGKYFTIHHKTASPAPPELVNGEYASVDYLMTRDALDSMLALNNYYQTGHV